MITRIIINKNIFIASSSKSSIPKNNTDICIIISITVLNILSQLTFINNISLVTKILIYEDIPAPIISIDFISRKLIIVLIIPSYIDVLNTLLVSFDAIYATPKNPENIDNSYACENTSLIIFIKEATLLDTVNKPFASIPIYQLIKYLLELLINHHIKLFRTNGSEYFTKRTIYFLVLVSENPTSGLIIIIK